MHRSLQKLAIDPYITSYALDANKEKRENMSVCGGEPSERKTDMCSLPRSTHVIDSCLRQNMIITPNWSASPKKQME